MSRLVIMLLLAGAVVAQEEGATAPPNFAQPGPCATSTTTAKFPVPSKQSSGKGRLPSSLQTTFTLPSCKDASPFGTPAPLLFLYNGFQVRRGGEHSLRKRT